MAKSIEEDIENVYKRKLSDMGVKIYRKNAEMNNEIDEALKKAESKSGGKGSNYPDIRALADNGKGRRIPVMIEAKGRKGDLVKLDASGSIVQETAYAKDTKTHKAGDLNWSAVMKYAVNGAYHYAKAVIENSLTYSECIFVGINGWADESGDVTGPDGEMLHTEEEIWYLSEKNRMVPKKLDADISILGDTEKLFGAVDMLSLSDDEIEALTKKTEEDLDRKLRMINQLMQETLQINVNYRVDLIAGMIMAGMGAEGVEGLRPEELRSLGGSRENDGTVIMNRIESYLEAKNLPRDKMDMICNMLRQVFVYNSLWTPVRGESKLKKIYLVLYREILPIFRTEAHIDFTGKLFNVLNEWVQVPDGDKNDVVLTPRYVTDLMVALCEVNMDTYLADYCTGSGSFLVSGMKAMLADAKKKIKDPKKLMEKEIHIKMEQLLGIEKLSDVWMLCVLNLLLMGDGSSHVFHGDSLKYDGTYSYDQKPGSDKRVYPINVACLNPPYSTANKGFIFLESMLKRMKDGGKAAIIIQENAGSGQGVPCTKRILENNTLLASIHMPTDLFGSKASVQTAIYVFDAGKPHNEKQPVKFIDFSNDGYTRQNRKKSSQEVNLRDTDHAKERYEELGNAVLYGRTALHYLKEGETYFEDTITLNGDDWTFAQHKKIDMTPTEEDFMREVESYLSWKVGEVLKGRIKIDEKDSRV